MDTCPGILNGPQVIQETLYLLVFKLVVGLDGAPTSGEIGDSIPFFLKGLRMT